MDQQHPGGQPPQTMNPVNLPIMNRPKLRELAGMVAPGERFEQAVEGILVKVAEDFVSKLAQSSSEMARHRKSKVLEADDVQLCLGICAVPIPV